jgi:hypothetical protein
MTSKTMTPRRLVTIFFGWTVASLWLLEWLEVGPLVGAPNGDKAFAVAVAGAVFTLWHRIVFEHRRTVRQMVRDWELSRSHGWTST